MAETVKIHGLKELEKTLAQTLPQEAYNITRGAVFDIAAILRDKMKERVPVREGDLKRSIKAKRNRGTRTKLEASVIADKSGGRSGRGYHAHFIEFGTVKMTAQPYVTPTVEQERQNIQKYFRERVGVRLEKALEKRELKK